MALIDLMWEGSCGWHSLTAHCTAHPSCTRPLSHCAPPLPPLIHTSTAPPCSNPLLHTAKTLHALSHDVPGARQPKFIAFAAFAFTFLIAR